MGICNGQIDPGKRLDLEVVMTFLLILLMMLLNLLVPSSLNILVVKCTWQNVFLKILLVLFNELGSFYTIFLISFVCLLVPVFNTQGSKRWFFLPDFCNVFGSSSNKYEKNCKKKLVRTKNAKNTILKDNKVIYFKCSFEFFILVCAAFCLVMMFTERDKLRYI